jgi:hypothetical protein
MALGRPRHSMSKAWLRMARAVSSEKSISMPSPSRFKSLSAFAAQKPARQRSRTLSRRNWPPSAARQAHGFMRRERPRRSAMKSPLGDALHCLPATIDRTKFGASGTANGSGLSRFSLLRGLIRRFSSSSRVIRLTVSVGNHLTAKGMTPFVVPDTPLNVAKVQKTQAKPPTSCGRWSARSAGPRSLRSRRPAWCCGDGSFR